MFLKEYENFIDSVRYFFKSRGYIEVFTPILQEYPNIDPNVEPIRVSVRIPNEKILFLHTSPENAMKKLLSKYKKDIFQITKAFRDKELGKWHNVEFTMLEWYKIGQDFNYLIQEIGELLKFLQIAESYEIISVEHAFEEYAGIILSEDEEIFKNNLLTYGYEFDDQEDWETLFYRVYVEVERKLGTKRPTFLIKYPKRLSAYAKITENYAERFELYIKGIEIANGWTEETSKEEILKRMEVYRQNRDLPIDKDLINAYENMPPCAGCSIGLDRLFMILKGIDGFKDLRKYVF